MTLHHDMVHSVKRTVEIGTVALWDFLFDCVNFIVENSRVSVHV